MKRLCLIVLLLVFAGIVSSFGNAEAATLVSNLGNTDGGSTYVDYNSWFGVQFTTGPNGPYTLGSATIQSLGSDSANFQVAIYSDAAGPATLLEVLNGTAIHPAGLTTFYSSGIILASSTAYFIVVREDPSSANGGSVRSTADLGETSSDGWTIANGSYASGNQGASWSPSSALFKFSIATPSTAVPALNQWGMVIFALLAGGMAVFYVRRKARA